MTLDYARAFKTNVKQLMELGAEDMYFQDDCELEAVLLSFLTVPMLKKMLRERRLKTTGTKSELITHLVYYHRPDMNSASESVDGQSVKLSSNSKYHLPLS